MAKTFNFEPGYEKSPALADLLSVLRPGLAHDFRISSSRSMVYAAVSLQGG